MFQVRLINELNERACSQRNALTERPAPIALNAGTVGTVLEVLDGGDALLVEFGSRGSDRCDWLGVLHATEVELWLELFGSVEEEDSGHEGGA